MRIFSALSLASAFIATISTRRQHSGDQIRRVLCAAVHAPVAAVCDDATGVQRSRCKQHSKHPREASNGAVLLVSPTYIPF